MAINSSLSALGNVLSALSKNAAIAAAAAAASAASSGAPSAISRPTGSVQVPYRDSKLTHLLKDSLGGNSKTLMLATLRGTVPFYQHTVLSLMYAMRAKKIQNRSTVNRDVANEQVNDGTAGESFFTVSLAFSFSICRSFVVNAFFL